MCPELFDHILLQAIPQICSDRPSYSWTTDAQEHLVRLHNIIADNWKMTPGGDIQTPHPPLMIHSRIGEYLAASRFPLFQHEARIALNTDRGV